jgi:virginiamycin B lyase
VIDANGVVWFAQIRGNKIGRYGDGGFSEYSIPTAAAGVTGLAVAPDGAVWFTETRGHKLGRLRDSAVTEIDLPRGDARPFGIAVDRAGNVWYTDISGKLGMLPADRAR